MKKFVEQTFSFKTVICLGELKDMEMKKSEELLNVDQLKDRIDELNKENKTLLKERNFYMTQCKGKDYIISELEHLNCNTDRVKDEVLITIMAYFDIYAPDIFEDICNTMKKMLESQAEKMLADYNKNPAYYNDFYKTKLINTLAAAKSEIKHHSYTEGEKKEVLEKIEEYRKNGIIEHYFKY